MASCLVPDFPAVMVALEHLKELDKQLKEEEVPFAPEASLHLTEMTAAITELETERRAAHEHLEVETIENSKLRHQINNIRERMSQDIMADVAAARASNAEETEQLHKDLNTVSQLREAAVRRHDALSGQNKELHLHREQGKAEREELVATLNNHISLKYSLQMQLSQIQERIDELKSTIADVEHDKVALEQSMVLDREAFTVKKDNLSHEVNQTGERIKQQKQAIRKSRRALNRVNDKKQETHGRLGELTSDVAKLESNLQRLTASRCQFEKQLEGETQKHQELRKQRETLKKELCKLGEVFSLAVQRLKGEIVTLEDKIEQGQGLTLLTQDRLAHISEIFKRQHDEENQVKAEHFHVSQQLERSKLQLEERIASVVKHSKEIKEMNKQLSELLETNTVNKRVFERNQEELCGNMDTEKKNVHHFEEEERRLRRLLVEAKRTQEKHVAKVTSDISCTRRRYEELRQEEATFLQRQPKSEDADLLMSYITQCVEENRQIQIRHHQEIEQCTAEMENITRSNEEKEREVKEKEELLREVEAKWNEEQTRYQRLKMLVSELRQRRAELEWSVQGLKDKTNSLLQPKGEMKEQLEETRASHMDVIKQQATELRAVETSIYESRVKLEQVRMENSRLHLSITRMTEDVSRARGDKDRYWHDTQQFSLDKRALFESLQEAWREDVLLTEDYQSSDGVLVVHLSALSKHLNTRRQQIGNVSTLLRRQMLDFSKRLGDKTMTDQHS